MQRFLPGRKPLGHQQCLNGYIVNYTDDFVICCRGTALQSMKVMRGMMDRLGLTVNEDKRLLRRLPDGSFDSLGYTIGRCCHAARTGRDYIGTRPSRKSVRRAMTKVSKLTDRRTARRPADEVVSQLKRLLLGRAIAYASVRSASRTGHWTRTPDMGSAGGCVGSTRKAARGPPATPTTNSTTSWGSYVLP